MSAAALARAWRTTAAVALGLAVSVEVLRIVLLPIHWKRVRIRDAVLATAVVGLFYVAVLDHGAIPIGSLGTYVQRFRFNDPVFAALERLAPPKLVAGLALLAALLTAAWLRRAVALSSLGPFAWPMAACLVCAPVVYPWYLLWLLPFLTSASTLPITVWTACIIPTYVVWHLRTLGRPWVVPGWVMLLEYGTASGVGAVIALRRLQRRARRYGVNGSSETTSIHLIEEERP